MPGSGITIANTFATQSGNVPASQLDTNFGQLASGTNALTSYGNYFIDSGVANMMAITVPAPLVVAYVAGLPLQVQVAATNTSAMTLNVNGLGAVPVTAPDGTQLAAGSIVIGAIMPLQYDGARFQYLGPIVPPVGVSSLAAGAGIAVNANTGPVQVTNIGVTSAAAGAGIGVSGATGAVTFSNAGVTQLSAGAGINLSGSTGNVTVSATGAGSSGSFSATLTGMIAATVGTVNYAINGTMCTLQLHGGGNFTGSSNQNFMSMTGIIALCRPSVQRTTTTIVIDNGNSFVGQAQVGSGGTIAFGLASLGGVSGLNLELFLNGFSATGNPKGLGSDWYIQYPL
jgi:hypothetical protein